MNREQNNTEVLKKSWSAQEDILLRKLVVDQDLPYDKAAKILGRGRAACISRGRRLGIKKGRRIVRGGATRSNHPWRNRRLPAQHNSTFPQFGPDSPLPSLSGKVPFLPLESSPSHRPLDSRAPIPKRLIDLKPSECRWPVGEVPHETLTGTETVFCGCQTVKGKSYCKAHDEMAHVRKEDEYYAKDKI